MHRLFLDANVLFSAACSSGTLLRRLWKLPGAELLTSSYAIGEARRNLSERGQRQDLEELLNNVSAAEAPASGTEMSMPEGIELPEKDVPILLAAIAARATHLVTGDVTHFGSYFGERIESVLVLAPGDYLRGFAGPGVGPSK